MKKAILFLGLAGLAFTSAHAEKIGVVDIEQIGQKYTKAQENAKRMQEKVADAKKLLTEREAAVIKLRTEVEGIAKDAENPTLNDAARAGKKSEFQSKAQSFEKARQDLGLLQQQIQQSIQQSGAQLQQDIFREVREKAAAVAKEKQLDLVVPAAATLYTAESLDITADVLKKLNEAYAANPVTPSAPVTAAPEAAKPAAPAAK